MAIFTTRIITPSGRSFDGTVESLVLPGADGLFGVLGGHAPMVAVLAAGVLRVQTGEDALFFAVGAGLVEVGKTAVSILTDFAIQADTELMARQKLAEHSSPETATPIY